MTGGHAPLEVTPTASARVYSLALWAEDGERLGRSVDGGRFLALREGQHLASMLRGVTSQAPLVSLSSDALEGAHLR